MKKRYDYDFQKMLKRHLEKVLMGCIPLLLLFLPLTGQAQSDGLPRGANEMPYERYEAESSSLGNGASILGPTYDQLQLASEATDRRFVTLSSSGSSVEWQVRGSNQDGLTLRYSIPDNTSGTLALYVNDQKVRDIELTSYWAWQYFDVSPSTNGVPSNTPIGSNPQPRMRFDELHFILDTALNPGDIIKLQKDTNDGNAYGIDFIELESVPDPIGIPPNFISIDDYGATANDDTNDARAFRTAFDIANGDPSIAGVYIPAGRYINGQGDGSPTGNLFVGNQNLAISGAGMWYTELYFSSTNPNGAGFLFNADAITLSDMYLNSATNSRIAGNKAVNGTVGNNSTFRNIWVEHFETGFWLTSIQNNGVWNVTDGLLIDDCRVRNVYADGTNFTKGTRNSTVRQTSFRNCIDDAMATWSVNFLEPVPPTASSGNIFSNNTVENNLRAGGIGFFGGFGHKADHLLIKDSFAGSGIRVNTQFPAYPFGSDASQSIDISECTVTGSGTTQNIYSFRWGAIELELAAATPPGQLYSLQYVNMTNIDIIDSQHDAIFIHSFMPTVNNEVLNNVFLTNINIDGTGKALDVNNGPLYNTADGEGGGYGIYAANFSPQNTLKGWVELAGVSFSDIATEDILNAAPEDFEIRFGSVSDVTGVSVSSESLTLEQGDTATLDATVEPANAGNKSVSWSSSDTDVATVDAQGVVTAVGAGEATITVTTEEGNFTASTVVSVEAVITTAASIAVEESDASEDGATASFTISATEVTSDIEVNYSLSGNASADDYTANPALTGSITLTSANASQTIRVLAIDDSELEGSETLVITLEPGDGYILGADTSGTINLIDNELQPCDAPAIAQANGIPTIGDGIDGAWAIAPLQSIENTVIGSTPADFSGSWRALYDSSNLYVLVQVSDATLTNDSGGEWWNDDTVEIFIDGDNSKGSTYDGANDFQLGFRWDDAAVKAGGNSVQNVSGIAFDLSATAYGYVLEVAIPWSTIGVSPASGDEIGFDVAIDDDDNGGARDSQVASLATTDAGWNNPSVFGSVFLTTCTDGGTNQAPTANAGTDQSVESTVTSVSLQGIGNDPDGDALTYSWTQTAGPSATIASATSAATDISGLAPDNNYTFTLTVSDGELSASDTVTVQVAAEDNGGGGDGGGGNSGEGFTIQNVWTNTYLQDGGDTVTYADEPSGDTFYWVLEEVGGGRVEFRNVATGDYMHVENLTGSVQCSSREPVWDSSKWIVSDTGEGSVRIMNVWQNNQYIHVENETGAAQFGQIFPVWASAKWLFEENSAANAQAAAGSSASSMIVPNPADEQFVLQLGATPSEGSVLAIYDFSGKVLTEQPVNGKETEVYVGNLAPGVYVVKVISGTTADELLLTVK